MNKAKIPKEEMDKEMEEHPAIAKIIIKLIDDMHDIKTYKIENIAITVVLSLIFAVSFTTLVLLLLKIL